MNIQLFVYETFRLHKNSFIQPAIVHTWHQQQADLLQEVADRSRTSPVILGGDMRCDSPGMFVTTALDLFPLIDWI